jgi:WD40 repeat protein
VKSYSINESGGNIVSGGNSKLSVFGKGEMIGLQRLIIEDVAINQSGTLIAAAFDDNSIGIWDVATKLKVMELFGAESPITDLQFSPDGKLLLSSSLDGIIRLWGVP